MDYELRIKDIEKYAISQLVDFKKLMSLKLPGLVRFWYS